MLQACRNALPRESASRISFPKIEAMASFGIAGARFRWMALRRRSIIGREEERIADFAEGGAAIAEHDASLAEEKLSRRAPWLLQRPCIARKLPVIDLVSQIYARLEHAVRGGKDIVLLALHIHQPDFALRRRRFNGNAERSRIHGIPYPKADLAAVGSVDRWTMPFGEALPDKVRMRNRSPAMPSGAQNRRRKSICIAPFPGVVARKPNLAGRPVID